MFITDPPPIIVDASAAIEFLDANPAWVTAFKEWADDDRTLLCPSQFLAEVANAELRGRRSSSSDVAVRVERLVASGIETADRGLHGLFEAIDLAGRHGLTVYDALYLQLALDVDGELATLDENLRRAAKAEDLEVIS
jgi:predicted nucleic acid-binding protein